MDEYISREALVQELMSRDFYPVVVKRAIEAIPAADVVEVVRCKDCYYYGDDEYCPALILVDYTNPDDFCCWGERRYSDDD